MQKKPHLLNYFIVLSALLLTGSCSSGTDNSSDNTDAVAQTFEISIDGKTIKMNPDAPEDGMVVSGFAGSPGGYGFFGFSAFNIKEDFTFGIIAHIDLKPGIYEVFQCHIGITDCEDSDQKVILTPYPTGEVPNDTDGKFAYKDPDLGLEPLKLELTSVNDVNWPGVGAAKRAKGTFKGKLATVVQDANNKPVIVGPVKQIEGKFDLYCSTR